MGIGFATVSTVLYINGNVNIESNSEDFDVKFTSAVIDNEDKSSEAISVDGKTINFTTKELQALNDKSVLDFEITNNSSLYDAEVSIECTSGENDNSKGPITALSAIESATSEWSNVNTLNYTMGTTVFKENAFTGCTATECTSNMYNLSKNNVKARMIVLQEAISLGCKGLSEQSCPTWLRPSSGSYWTMSATTAYSTAAWFVYSAGWLDSHFVDYNIGARAVVVISK